jgi:hypothetical protein
MTDKILVCEISGKRPGTSKERPTEKYSTRFPHVIISNNSEGYDTDWEIINVPEEYREWYIANIKNSENAWMAPMNRSYAIKYAKEHGYRYCVQLDDNINLLSVSYNSRVLRKGDLEITKGYHRYSRNSELDGWLDDFINLLVLVLKNSNAGMTGMQMVSAAQPDDTYLAERYCYSFFCVDVMRAAPVFQGDFEDDIEYRLKLAQMGVPVIQLGFISYAKIGQLDKKDKSGCRAEYDRAGLKRGAHMSQIAGDVYKCGLTRMPKKVGGKKLEHPTFRHRLKPVKVGCLIKRKYEIDDATRALFKKYAKHRKPLLEIYENNKRVYRAGGGDDAKEDGAPEG